MHKQVTDVEHRTEETKPSGVERTLAALGWGLFFVWVGAAWLAGVGIGISLLGVGVITFGIQLARKYFGVAMEGLWLVFGLLFVLGGLAQLYALNIPVVPIVLIAAGLLLLVPLFRRRR